VTGCTGPALTLDGSGCVTANHPNTASGPMTYDGGGHPVQEGSASWPYPCPQSQANGLARDPVAGLWTDQTTLPTFTAFQHTTLPGGKLSMAFDGWTENTAVASYTLVNPTCLPLQVVAAVTLRAVAYLYPTEYVQMVAWIGQGDPPDRYSRQYLPLYHSRHVLDPGAPGGIPVVMPATLTARLALEASGSAVLTMYQGLYHNYGGNPAPNGPGAGTTTGNLPGKPPTPGYVTAFATEMTAWAWPEPAPVSDG